MQGNDALFGKIREYSRLFSSLDKNTLNFFFSLFDYTEIMADDSKQGFLNTLFQWTVKNTAAEGPTTTSDIQPMNEDVSTSIIRIDK